jgi:hypothetical protein
MGKEDSSHARYVATRFIPNSKLVFIIESVSFTDCRMEINSETINELFVNKSLSYLRSELVLLTPSLTTPTIQTSATKP